MPENKKIIYPYFFAAYPILYLFKVNINQLSPHIMLLPLLVSGVVTYFLLKLFYKYSKDGDKAAVGVSLVFLWLFSYSSVRSVLMFEIFGILFYRHRYFIIIWLVILFVLIIIYRKKSLKYNRIGEYLKYFSYAFIFILIIQICVHIILKKPDVLPFQGKIPEVETKISANKDSLPDIYYIILDAYAGQIELQNVLGFDNSNFLDYLRGKGFFVADSSHSNYAWTALSIASTLNMEYLPVKHLNEGSSKIMIDPQYSTYENIVNNKLGIILKNAEYNFVDLSIWSNSSLRYTIPSAYSDQFVVNNFNLALMQMTFIGRPLVDNYLFAFSKRSEIENKFRTLKSIEYKSSPQFIYAHFLIPHHPYVFSIDGSPQNFLSGVIEMGSEKKLYTDQLLFANGEMVKVIDTILNRKSNGIEPIIIIQGDHGAFNLGKSKEENIRLRMNILNAYYVPKACKKILYKSITPVNSFRIILNSCFGTSLPLLPDKNFYSGLQDFTAINEVSKEMLKLK